MTRSAGEAIGTCYQIAEGLLAWGYRNTLEFQSNGKVWVDGSGKLIMEITMSYTIVQEKIDE